MPIDDHTGLGQWQSVVVRPPAAAADVKKEKIHPASGGGGGSGAGKSGAGKGGGHKHGAHGGGEKPAPTDEEEHDDGADYLAQYGFSSILARKRPTAGVRGVCIHFRFCVHCVLRTSSSFSFHSKLTI